MAIGKDNKDWARGFTYTWYDNADRGQDSKYPPWSDGAPNLQTYLDAINKSQPIIQCQYEMVWSRWPRTLFFAKNINIPGVQVETQDLNHAGFTIKIPTHVTYESTEVTFNVIADKEGFHYYDLRNMVLQTGHPLVAGDPKATISNPYGISPDEDTIEIRLRNTTRDQTHHHWIIHNFHPTKIGDIELSQDGSSFVEFEITGTFTHITYDCGKTSTPEESPTPAEEDQQESQETQPQGEDEGGGDENGNEGDEEPEESEESEESEDEDYWDDQDEWSDKDWEEQEEIEKTEEPSEDSEDEGEATLDDEDERSAYEMLKESGDKSDEELLSDL